MTNALPLEWVFDRCLPEAERTRPAAELAAALRERRPVRVDGAVIAGDLELDSLDYPHKLVAVHTVFLGHVHAAEARMAHTVDLSGCEFRENVNFFGLRVNGQLKLQRARILRGSRPVIRHNFDQIEILGRLHAPQLRSEVPLSFRQARLGEIGLDGLQVDGDLDFQIARVAGDLFCQGLEDHPAVIRGSLRMAGIEVGGHVDLCGLRVEGDLDLTNGVVRGDVLIGGRLFDPPGEVPVPRTARELRRERFRERREFFRRLLARGSEPEEGTSRLKLDRARLSRLEIRERIPDRISADGMTFADLALPRCESGCEYSELLRKTTPFKRSTYLAVESWLRNMGLDQAAARVYIQMSERDLNTGHSSRLRRWARWLLLGVGIGYGARPLRLIGPFLLTFALSCWIFSRPDALVSYTEVPAGRPDAWAAEARNIWVTLGVALRCHFPMLLFLGDPNYVPSPYAIRGLGLTYSGYSLLVSAVSWVMVPLFLAGLTGIVRQRR